MTTAYYGPSDPEAKKFLFGGIAPNLGEMWGSKFANFAPIFSKSSSTLTGVTIVKKCRLRFASLHALFEHELHLSANNAFSRKMRYRFYKQPETMTVTATDDFSAIYTSRAYAMMSVSVCLSVCL